ncbi:MAG: tetratricopeptide repeat protein, partial [bacterium]|nr:tetratricopeptide repeat protein [bacterium]
ALKHLVKAAELNPGNADIHYRLGSIYNNAMHNLPEAETSFSRALDIDPLYQLAWQQRGICFFNQGKQIEAESDYRKAAELGDAYSAYCLNSNGMQINTSGEMVSLARDFWAQNNTQAAVDCFMDAIKQGFETRRKALEAKLELADKLSWLKRTDEAEHWYTAAIEEAPEAAESWSRRGWHYYCVSRDADAEIDFRKALSLDPDNILFTARLGNLYAVTGRHARGIAILDPAITNYPFSSDLFQARALCHRDLGNEDQAKSDFRQADFFGDPNAMNNRRTAYGNEDAIDFFQAGVELGQNNDSSEAVEQFSKAAEMFKQKIKYTGDKAWRYTAKSLHNKGLNMHSSGAEPKGAAAAVKKALEMIPFYVDAWATLGNIYNSSSNNEGAMECYSTMIKLQPNEGRGFYSRGRIRMAEGIWDQGVDDFT